MPDATTTTENNLLSTVGFCDYENIKPGKALEMQKSYGKEFALIQITDPYKYTEITGGSSFFIPSSSERPDKAMQLWNLMFTDPEVSNLFVNGLEGKHWVYTDDTHTFITTPEGMDSTASGYSCVDWSWPNPRITLSGKAVTRICGISIRPLLKALWPALLWDSSGTAPL